jgi:uncharacterized membrane protein
MGHRIRITYGAQYLSNYFGHVDGRDPIDIIIIVVVVVVVIIVLVLVVIVVVVAGTFNHACASYPSW